MSKTTAEPILIYSEGTWHPCPWKDVQIAAGAAVTVRLQFSRDALIWLEFRTVREQNGIERHDLMWWEQPFAFTKDEPRVITLLRAQFTYSIHSLEWTPDWVKSSENVWMEDDASRAAHDDSRERIEAAWERKFGVPFPDREARLDAFDGGDSFYYLHAGGRIEGFSYEGKFIRQLKGTS